MWGSDGGTPEAREILNKYIEIYSLKLLKFKHNFFQKFEEDFGTNLVKTI